MRGRGVRLSRPTCAEDDTQSQLTSAPSGPWGRSRGRWGHSLFPRAWPVGCVHLFGGLGRWRLPLGPSWPSDVFWCDSANSLPKKGDCGPGHVGSRGRSRGGGRGSNHAFFVWPVELVSHAAVPRIARPLTDAIF